MDPSGVAETAGCGVRLKIAFFASSSFVKVGSVLGVIGAACVVSRRWSYGPEGLREKPPGWTGAELWRLLRRPGGAVRSASLQRPRAAEAFVPRWRDLQPLLIRSAGVVGIAATIMAVVSSDALRFEPEPLPAGRNSVPADPQATIAPAIAASPAIPPEPAAEAPPAAPVKAASVEIAAPAVAAGPSPSPAAPPVPELRKEGSFSPGASPAAPVTTASVQPQADPVKLPSPASAPSGAAAPSSPAPLTALRASVAPAAGADDPAWTAAAADCPRDWLAGDAPGAPGSAGGKCKPMDEMLAALPESGQSAIEEAASDHAESLSMVPRVPLPRPDAVPAIKPARAARASGAGLGPPPNCPAGQRAKWHYVDRKAGTREWYCR